MHKAATVATLCTAKIGSAGKTRTYNPDSSGLTAVGVVASKFSPQPCAATTLRSLAPQVRLELTTLRLTAECSTIELLRKKRPALWRIPERARQIFITDEFVSVKRAMLPFHADLRVRGKCENICDLRTIETKHLYDTATSVITLSRDFTGDFAWNVGQPPGSVIILEWKCHSSPTVTQAIQY